MGLDLSRYLENKKPFYHNVQKTTFASLDLATCDVIPVYKQ